MLHLVKLPIPASTMRVAGLWVTSYRLLRFFADGIMFSAFCASQVAAARTLFLSSYPWNWCTAVTSIALQHTRLPGTSDVP